MPVQKITRRIDIVPERSEWDLVRGDGESQSMNSKFKILNSYFALFACDIIKPDMKKIPASKSRKTAELSAEYKVDYKKGNTAKVTIACRFVAVRICLPNSRYGLDGFHVPV
jgi:hypothetical protein